MLSSDMHPELFGSFFEALPFRRPPQIILRPSYLPRQRHVARTVVTGSRALFSKPQTRLSLRDMDRMVYSSACWCEVTGIAAMRFSMD